MIGRSGARATAPAAIAATGDIGSASTTYIGTQVLGVSALPVAAAAKDPGPIFIAVGVEMFTGREWLADEVDRFVAANPCGYVFVEAEAGLGKTAFAAWLVKTRGYLSHFSRYSEGRSVRVALQNLSAQLTREFELDDQAPGGILPEWAQTPSGFETVLGLAAARARQSGRRLVLVVDGLDEAESSDDILAFGLPPLLPDGVYVVCTYRTGHAPGRPDSPAVTVRISKADQRNTSDIRNFLAKAVKEEILAAKLAETGMDPAAFTGVLAERCDGVRVYLRYVLQEVRLGLRSPDAIADMPSGLRDYYADQIRRWQRDPVWNEALLPLLATLGAAGEALPITVLARLAGDLDPAAVRRWCDFTVRPLLTTARAVAETDSPLRYEIYHSSFREILKALPSGQPADAGAERSYDPGALADELRHATLSAHTRIADNYLTHFGGLDTGLPVLAKQPAAAGIDDGYPLRHLAGHLHYGGRDAELHLLLATANTERSSHEVNVWFTAHDHADRVASYLDDLARARNNSTNATDNALARHQPASSLGTEIRYALMAASIASRAARVSPKLLNLLARTGLWSPERGLDHARRLSEPDDRFYALLTVHHYANSAEGTYILKEALAAATTISNEYIRSQALTALAPHLPPGLLNQALAGTATCSDYRRAEMLAALAPHLPPHQQADALAQALDAAIAVTYEEYRGEALALIFHRG